MNSLNNKEESTHWKQLIEETNKKDDRAVLLTVIIGLIPAIGLLVIGWKIL